MLWRCLEGGRASPLRQGDPIVSIRTAKSGGAPRVSYAVPRPKIAEGSKTGVIERQVAELPASFRRRADLLCDMVSPFMPHPQAARRAT
jgi:hypothetical protein